MTHSYRTFVRSGELLRGAADRGWIEMTETYARVASETHGLEIERASIECAKSLDEESSYDVVTSGRDPGASV